jgi:hypothetical protein
MIATIIKPIDPYSLALPYTSFFKTCKAYVSTYGSIRLEAAPYIRIESENRYIFSSVIYSKGIFKTNKISAK